MTIAERVRSIVGSQVDLTDEVPAGIEKMIYMAYYMGREDATREISDRYNALLREQRQRAQECRYHNLAAAIVGDVEYIYSSDYAKEMTSIFGGDPADV